MGSVHFAYGFRFAIYTDDHEPPHVHVLGNDGEAIINLSGPYGRPEPIYVINIKRPDMKRLMAVVIDGQQYFLNEWLKIHGPQT